MSVHTSLHIKEWKKEVAKQKADPIMPLKQDIVQRPQLRGVAFSGSVVGKQLGEPSGCWVRVRVRVWVWVWVRVRVRVRVRVGLGLGSGSGSGSG